MRYKPKVNDIVLIKSAKMLGQIINVSDNDVQIIIFKSNNRDDEGWKRFFPISDLKLVWRRKKEIEDY